MADPQDTSGAAPEEGATSGRGKFDFGLIAGTGIAFFCIGIGIIMEGSQLNKYLPWTVGQAAFVIVIIGTLMVTLGSVGWPQFKRMVPSTRMAATYKPPNRGTSIRSLVAFAEKARREGLLVLEDDLRNTDDEFMRRGMQLVVDGTDPQLVKDILTTEIDTMHSEIHTDAKTFEIQGGYAPTLGIMGAVLGLILALSDISDAAGLAKKISLAFIATLYGVGYANMVCLPIGMRLKAVADEEVAARELVLEGILAIQAGDNPRIVEEKLLAFLPADERLAYRAGGEDDADADLDLAA